MVTIKKIIKKFGGNVCRKCINDTYSIHLTHEECQYTLPYPAKCACCGEMKNIVTGFRFGGFMKLLTK